MDEYAQSVTMPGDNSENPYGIAIDSKLAIALIKSLVDKLPPSQDDWTAQLLRNSRSVTFDKNALLKTISQPSCEGIRFYLCLQQPDKASKKDVEPGEYLSLVTVC